jgi:hypothetical protein
MISYRERLELELERAWLAVLLNECEVRRQQMLEALGKTKAAGDLAAYRRLMEEWRRHPHVFGSSPPPV